MTMRLFMVTVALSALTGAAANPAPVPMPGIAIATAPEYWSATYKLARPAQRLVFARSPDHSRTATWIAPLGFQIVASANGEEVSRRDGAPFSAVTLRMPPLYRHLSGDYAPFSPFGDGGMLFHSGRFFACPDACPDRPHWRMSIAASPQDRVIVNGAVQRRTARWTDGKDGRSVYVGAGHLTHSGDLVAVIDGALPAAVRGPLDADLPRFMRFFAARLGALRQAPMLFVSYDADHRGGWGRQGGTLPGQVFVHFYGAGWPARMAAPGFGFDLAWHLAHESAHLYQRGMEEPGAGNAWVHEGAAEASAAIALEALDPAYAPLIDAKRREAEASCAKATRDRSLRTVIAEGNFDVAYSCGLVINAALHRNMLAAKPGSSGLFAVWDAYMAGRQRRSPLSYLDAVAQVAGRCAADALETSAATPGAATGMLLTACDRLT